MTRSSTKTTTIILLILWGLAFAGLLYLGNQTRMAVQMARSASPPYPGEENNIHIKGLSAKSQLLLNGDTTQETKDARWRALHESDPENVLFYLIYLQNIDKIPEDFRETVARIDPDNGWFSIWEVSKQESGFEKSHGKRLSSSEKKELTEKGLPIPPMPYDFTDLETFREHLAILEKGLLTPRVEHHTEEIATLRFKAVPTPVDFVSNINAIAVSVGYIGPVFSWKDCAEMLCAALQISEGEKDFHRLEKLCQKLEEHLYKNSTTLVSGLVYKAVVWVHSSSLRAAAERLNLPEAETFYRERQMRFQNESERQSQSRNNETDDLGRLISRRTDILMALSIPAMHMIVPDPPELTAKMLKPALRTERAIAARIFYSAFFIVLSLCSLIVWLRGRNRENPATFLPESRTLFFCSLLPFALLLIFRYFLSFGMLNFGGGLLIFWNYLLPEIAIVLTLLVIPQIMMNKKAHPERSFFRTWWPAGVAILGLLFSSAMMHLVSLGSGVFILPGLFAIVTFVWILSQLFRMPKPDSDRNGRIAPCYLFSATLCGLFVFALVAEERFWFKQEGPHHASATGLSILETEVTELLNEFVQELRGPDRR